MNLLHRHRTSAALESEQTCSARYLARLGEWWRYNDGLRVSASVARKTFSEHADGCRPGSQGLLVALTVLNQTGRVFDPRLVVVNLVPSAGERPARWVFDVDFDAFTEPIRAGKRMTRHFGFALPAHVRASQVLVEVQPGFREPDGIGYDLARFSGAVV